MNLPRPCFPDLGSIAPSNYLKTTKNFSTHTSRASCNLSLSTYPLPYSHFSCQALIPVFCFFVSLRNDEAVIGSIASAFSPTGFEFLNSPSHRAMSLQLPTVM